MNSRKIAVAVLLALMATAAAANECAPEVAKVDANLTTAAPIASAQFRKAKDLRDRAVALCAAGDVSGGLALLSQAKTILNIQ